VITLFAASNWPSDCGWNTEDSCSLMHASRNTSHPNWLVNTRSLSEMMEQGIPCKRMMLSKNAFVAVVVVAVYGCPRGMKCPYLENLSMTVKMTNLSFMQGNASVKSMVTSAHMMDGTLRGCSRPIGWSCSCCIGTSCTPARSLGPPPTRQVLESHDARATEFW
jgi:hypothetical protein